MPAVNGNRHHQPWRVVLEECHLQIDSTIVFMESGPGKRMLREGGGIAMEPIENPQGTVRQFDIG